jgi:hypothetical protein
VAVLHSERTHQRAGNGLYDPGPCLDRIRGAHQALLELHHPHDLLSEDALLRELERERGRYRVIVLPEQIALSPELEAPLADWVQHGGRLIASGRVAPRINEEIPVFALEELLGVQWTGRMEKEGFFVHRDQPLRVAAPVYPVALNGAETVLPLLRPAGSDAEGDPPAVTRHRVGQGEVFYVAADFFAAFHRCQYPGFRDLLGDVLELALPEAPFLTTAPPTVEVVLRRKEDQVILHFVNHSPGKSLAQNSAFIEEVPPSAPFSVTLALPVRPEGVRLQPDGTEPEWSYAEGTLAAFIPPVHVHEILVIS